jgi:hypothetical protein
MSTQAIPQLREWSAETVEEFLEHEQGDPHDALHALERQLNTLCVEDTAEALQRAQMLADVCDQRALPARALLGGYGAWRRYQAALVEQQRAHRLRKELADLLYYERLGY